MFEMNDLAPHTYITHTAVSLLVVVSSIDLS